MDDERGKKLLSNLRAAFCKDKDIEEYDYLPVLQPTHNCNPLILVDHRLGIEAWAAKVIFEYAYIRLIQWRRRVALTRDYDVNDIDDLTRAILLFNADNATAWNIRKELIEKKNLNISEDFKLSKLILNKHPKSPETFSHRKWLLSKKKCKSLLEIRENGDEHVATERKTSEVRNCEGSTPKNSKAEAAVFYLCENGQEQVAGEMSLCGAAADAYPNNYNAWSHRIWVLQHMTNNSPTFLASELQTTKHWTSMHVSDHSGFHYRQHLISSLGRKLEHLNPELEFVSDLILRYPGHEALWYHRRFAVQCLLFHHMSTQDEIPELNSLETAIKKTRTIPREEVIREREREFCARVIRDSKLLWQKTLSEKHLTWLDRTYKGISLKV